jgi:opacity protein-like surface antigen
VLSRAEVTGAAAADGGSVDSFASIDYNHNGLISREEWHWSRGSFDSRDDNGDGVISRREYNAPAVAGNTGSLSNRDVHREVTVPGTQRWTDAGIDVRAGDVIRVNADGTIQLSDNPADRANPSGASRRAPDAPVLDAPAGGLIVRVGDSAPIFVGANGSTTTPVSGRLHLGINDDHLPDNNGQFRVTVDIAR